MFVFGVRVLKHPGRTSSFLLQDDRYAFGGLGYMRNLVEVAGSFSILDDHELGRQGVAEYVPHDAFAMPVRLLFDDVCIIAKIFQPGRYTLQTI